MKQLAAQKAVETEIVDVSEQKLIDAKAKLASLEAELPYLLGQQTAGLDAKILRTWLDKDAQQPPDAGNAEMLRRCYLDVTGRLPTPDELAAGARPSHPRSDGRPHSRRAGQAVQPRLQEEVVGFCFP